MKPGVAGFKPKVLCTPDHFETDEQALLVRAIQGRIYDNMFLCAKRILEQQGYYFAPNLRRFEHYTTHLQEFLFAEKLTNEWCANQLSNLTADGQGGTDHKDTNNDGRASYDHVICLCLTSKDNLGNLWNCKFMATFRKRVGDFESGSMTNLLHLASGLRRFQESVSSMYIALIGRQYRGSYRPIEVPTCRNMDTFWLDDYMPFQCHCLSAANNIFQSYFVMPTDSLQSP
jgi:hypothetical protein